MKPTFGVADVITALAAHSLRRLSESLPNVANRSAKLVPVPFPFIQWSESTFMLADADAARILGGRCEEVPSLQAAISEVERAHAESDRFLDLERFVVPAAHDMQVASEAMSGNGLSVAVKVRREHLAWKWSLVVAGGKDRRASTREA